MAVWYRRASLTAVSTESEPPLVRKLTLSGTGAIIERRSVSSLTGGEVRSPKVE